MTTLIQLNAKAVAEKNCVQYSTNYNSKKTFTKPTYDSQDPDNGIKIEPLGGLGLRKRFWGG